MALKVKNLASGYGDVGVLRDITFNVDNEIFSVLGANGAGKTTLLKTLARLLPLSDGDIEWQGNSIRQTPAYDLPMSGIAYVPQEHNVYL